MTSTSNIPALSGDSAKAVAHRGGHIRSSPALDLGRPQTVSQRVARLVEEGVEPSRIVAFTFTERAAEELKARIRARVEHFAGSAAADKLGSMYVGTIHGFCFQLLTTYVTKYESYGVMDENQQAAFMQKNSGLLKVKELVPGPGGLFKGIAKLRESLDVIENEMLDLNLMPEELKFSATKFYELLDEHRLLTFGRQISAAVDALRLPEVHQSVTTEIAHLIVDEYQDVNPAQEELIRLLAQPVGSADLVVVGDDDQAIYQWRGSTVANITTFSQRYPGVTTFALLANRRSRPAIVDLANKFAASIPGRLDKEMQSSREDNGPAVDIAASFDTEEIEASELAMTIQRLHRLGYRYSEMAVLVRGKVAYPAILEAFEQHRIPVQPGGRTGLFEQPDADFLGRCIAWLVDYEWKRGFNSQKEKITLESLKDLAMSVYEIDEAGWKRFSGALAQFRMKVGQDSRAISFIDEIYALLDVLGVRDRDLEDPVRASRLGTIARFQKFIADYESIQMRARSTAEGQVGASDQKKFYFTNLAALMLNYAISDYTDFEGEEDLQSDSVELMTVHAAKGLEWPIVFLPSLTKKRFPSSNSGRSRDWLVPTNLFDTARYEGGDADERRLFYVAMTRAREWLSLTAHQRVSKITAPVSPYIQEAIGLHNSTLDFPAQWVSNAGDEVPDIYISYSDLAAYLSCGYSYWLKNRIGFPPALVEEIGYGNAVHHLMRVIAEETQRRGKTLGASDIDKILATDFFLPFANKTLAERFKNRARQLVDTYMKDHAPDMLRVWETERPFELALSGVVVSGRADVILDKEGGKEERLAIVDYKTEIDDRELGLQLQVYMARDSEKDSMYKAHIYMI